MNEMRINRIEIQSILKTRSEIYYLHLYNNVL